MDREETLRPARCFGPGYFIKEQMEYRNWTQEDLAGVMGITVKHLNKIVKDKQPLTIDMAKLLSGVFGLSAQYWLNLDTKYRLWLTSEPLEKVKQAALKAKIYERMPVRDMVYKKWMPESSDFSELHDHVLTYWGVQELDFEAWDKRVLPLLARKSDCFNQFRASYAYTWYQKALATSVNFQVNAYDKEQVLELFQQISGFTVQKDGINGFLRRLNEAGVIFFVLPHLQKTYLDGAAFYSNHNPVLVYTGRYKRVDNFWFSVAHELAHILFHLHSGDAYFVDNLKERSSGLLEREANEKAALTLKHPEILDYLKPKLNYLTRQSIVDCSDALGIHPAIIIGKLAHDKILSYANQTLFNEDVLEMIDGQYKVH